MLGCYPEYREAQEGEQRFYCLYYNKNGMPYPIKVCVICKEEFELKPDKPGFANRCPACSEDESANAANASLKDGDGRSNSELNAERRRVMRDLLYRKDS